MHASRAWRIVWRALTPAQRRRGLALQAVAIGMAASTVLSLAMVMGFLAVLAEPDLADRHEMLARIAGAPLASGLALLLLLVAATAMNVFGARALGRFGHDVGDRLRELLFAHYLRCDYLFHLQAGADPLRDTVLHQADRVVVALTALQTLASNGWLTALLVACIGWIDPGVALAGLLVVGLSYASFYRLVRRRVARHGEELARQHAERTRWAEQALTGLKPLRLAGAETYFEARFAGASRALSAALAGHQFLGQFPRFVLECLAGCALIAAALWLRGSSTSGAWLAQLSFMGLAGFRLLPAVQQMYNACVLLGVTRPALRTIAGELGTSGSRESQTRDRRAAAAPLAASIELDRISFRYSDALPWVLRELSLCIPAGSAVAIVGASGSGKTTLVDLLVGLLTPSAGALIVDGRALPADRRAWQQSVGYVPQEVVILDAPVRENIAFGIDPRDVDEHRVQECARLAGAHGFICGLSAGYATRLGAGGEGLSGGQRQRLGIARALYRRPSLLVLDEATSCLDAEAERSLVDNLIRQRAGGTVLVVAHRPALVEACDVVHELSGGRLSAREAVRRAGAR
jgi:ATP-binding cassette, subfamily B, bacterial PglK